MPPSRPLSPRVDPPELDAPVTGSALLDALKLVLAEIGTERAQSLTAADLATVLDRHDKARELSNPKYPGISPFSYPEGDRARPKPTLTREVWVNSARQDVSQLTPAEIDAFNALSDSLPRAGQERSSRGGKWIAKVSQNGARLLVILPCGSIEDRAEVNASSVGMFCRELSDGREAVTPESLLAQMAVLEAEVAKLRAAQTGTSAEA